MLINQDFAVKNLSGTVGSYAISTIDFDSWTKEPIIQPSTKGRRTRGPHSNRDTINKIFAECALAVQDPFWIDKFNEAASGKFPRKFTFCNGQLIYQKGVKSNILEVPNEPYEASQACMAFFRSNGGIFSSTDEQIALELQYSRAQAALIREDLTWANANKKAQECLLSYYITNMKQIMELSNLEVEQLRQTIRLGIVSKLFGKHNIRVEDNSIHSIDGLLWDSFTRSFYIDPEFKPNLPRVYARKKDTSSNTEASQKDTVPQFGVKWKKYIETLDKKRAKGIRRQRNIAIFHEDLSTISEDITSQTDDYSN